ncbi:MAG: NUDIX hydrolase [Culicoidibacterales bacterium]
MENLLTQLQNYQPYDEQERVDQQLLVQYLKTGTEIFQREQLQAHVTASAWITNTNRDQVLMIHHNLYNSWAWTGGHADGITDVLAVAIKEAKEETGVQMIQPVSEAIFSIEILAVNQHYKNGKFVPAHVHLNFTYLLEAADTAQLIVRPEENSQVSWMSLAQAVEACSEPCMRPIYQKLNAKLAQYR